MRDETGQLNGFYNVCRHRGHELVQGVGVAKKFACPYHAWVYALDGSLRHARNIWLAPHRTAQLYPTGLSAERVAGRGTHRGSRIATCQTPFCSAYVSDRTRH